MKVRLSAIFVIFFVLSAEYTSAQALGKRLRNNWNYKGFNTVGEFILIGGIGTSTYFGDLSGPGLSEIGSDYMKNQELWSDFLAGASYRLHTNFAVRGEFNYIIISGSDAGGKNASRNLSFRTHVFELSGVVVFDFLKQLKSSVRRFNPYAFAGVGAFYFLPTTKAPDGKWYSLRPIQTEGKSYSPISFAIPFGIGIRYKYTNRWAFALETNFRYTLTDHLDDVSDKYAQKSPGSLDELLTWRYGEVRKSGYAGQKRGNPGSKDVYFSAVLKVEYSIPWRLFANKFKSHKPRG